MKHLSELEMKFFIDHEITYKHSKSGGHWGQHINKKMTKAEWYFDITNCDLLDEEQKQWLRDTYHNHISKKWVMRLTCQEQRSYHQNLTILKKHYMVLFEYIWEKSLFDVLHHHRKKHSHKNH